ncbi:MAG: HesA/MoeB/ThiF family protein [Thermoplasmata archaeon]
MITVKFPSKLFSNLYNDLFSDMSRENGCFLLVSHHKSKNAMIAIVNEIVEPSFTSWNVCEDSSINPSSSYINEAIMRADTRDQGLIFVHTHPGSLHPPTFSYIDKQTNRRLLRNISEILPNRVHGSMVFTPSSASGILFDNGANRDIDRLLILGENLKEFPVKSEKLAGNGPRSGSDSRYDRQRKVLGDIQTKLQNLRIAIVGLGGTGSSVAVQLAMMGVGNLTLIDFDLVEESNLPKLQGATKKDVGKAKVDVIRRHLKKISESNVTAVKADITRDKVIPSVIESDILFGCTDNLTSRAILNDISLQYLIPLVDVGSRIHLNEKKDVDNILIKVQVVTPENACLWCSGTLDGVSIMQESIPEDYRKKLESEGYYKGVGKQPSIVPVNTVAASLGVMKFLNLIGGLKGPNDSRLQIELMEAILVSDTPEQKDDCICQKRRGVGDLRRIV